MIRIPKTTSPSNETNQVKAKKADVKTTYTNRSQNLGCIPKTKSGYQPNFPLRGFQEKAIKLIDENQSVLVSAPTGSGKTVIAAAAMYRALKMGKKLVYTAPIKALTNQKISEFKEEMARMYRKDHPNLTAAEALKKANEDIGLITGDHYDVHDKTKALIVTTEVLNLMLQSNFKGIQAGPNDLKGLNTIVHDEFHYLNDNDRGHVWEESIINTPKATQVIGLSATMGNAKEITDWVTVTTGKKMQLVEEAEVNRPVKLEFHIFNNQITDPTKVMAVSLNSKSKLTVKNTSVLRDLSHDREKEKYLAIVGMVQMLKDHDKLPAIVFKFSQNGCDAMAETVADAPNLKLLNAEEEKEIDVLIKTALADSPYLNNELKSIELLKKGVAAHHAGHLPQMKNLIEKLYEKRLIKVAFATSTLAAGINMPAKTTVLTELSNPATGDLTISEFKQMTGRAGRAGLDTEGNVFVFAQPNDSEKISRMVAAKADDIQSKMKLDYQRFFNHYKEGDKSDFDFNHFVSRSLLKYQESHKAVTEADPLAYTSSKMLAEFRKMKDLLTNSDFAYIDDNGKISKKGRIASYFKINNPIFLTEFLVDLCQNHQKELQDMDAANFAAMISLLAQDDGQVDCDTLNNFIDTLVMSNKNLLPFYSSLTRNFQKVLEKQAKKQITTSVPTINYEKFLTHLNWAKKKIEPQNKANSFSDVVKNDQPGECLRSIKQTINLLKQIHKAAQDNSKSLPGLAKLTTKAINSLNKDIVLDTRYTLAI